MPGRQYNPGNYRFGFNGKENDNEVKGTGNQQDYGMRIYDPRLGRFLSVDPLAQSYPWYTPYQFAGNNPVKFIDLDGLEPAEPGKRPGEYAVATVKGTDNDYGWTWTKDKEVNGGAPFWNQGCSTDFQNGNANGDKNADDLNKTNYSDQTVNTLCGNSLSCNENAFNAAYSAGTMWEGNEK